MVAVSLSDGKLTSCLYEWAESQGNEQMVQRMQNRVGVDITTLSQDAPGLRIVEALFTAVQSVSAALPDLNHGQQKPLEEPCPKQCFQFQG